MKKVYYKIGNVIIRVTNLKLWKYSKNNAIPQHKFRISIVDCEGRLLFKENMVLKGDSIDFEFRESALVYIKKALKYVDKNLIPQAVYEGDKFPKFLEEFNDKLNKILECGKAVCPLFD